VATLDELDEFDLELEARVNGEVWSNGSTRDRRYSFGDVLAWASYGEDVFPGEVIGVGTVETGCGLELNRWIQPGDVLEMEMSGVGVLRNRVGAKRVAPPGAGLRTYTGAPRWSATANGGV
jgi:2-keto-4-pentenoate hydratase/2-oxohepta-3-ene-1,7-dioic acid hydratase in catechol pathway